MEKSSQILFWGHADPPHNAWNVIKDTPEERQQAIERGATAFSTMSFSFPPEHGKEEPMRYGDLYLDFDSKKSPEVAIMEMKTFVQDHSAYYDFDPAHLRFWISGGKGCHLCIPRALYGDEYGSQRLPEIHKKMVEWLADDHVRGIHFITLDFAMYNMGKGRLLRIENIKRANGYYKVPVTWEELSTLSPAELQALTASPRNVPRSDAPVESCPGLASLFEEAATSIHKRDTECKRTSLATETAEDECLFIQHCRDNAATLSEPEWFAMISNLARMGRPGVALIHEYSKDYPNYSKEETNTKILHALGSRAPISCEAIQAYFACGKNCGVKNPMQLYQKAENTACPVEQCFEVKDDGVYYYPDPADHINSGKKICSPLSIRAQTRDPESKAWGRLVELADPDGQWHRMVLKNADMQGSGDAVLAQLVDAGLMLAPDKKARELVLRYLQVTQPLQRATLVRKSGWHGRVYVLNELFFGGKPEEIFIPEFFASPDVFSCAGDLESWQQSIAAPCLGNHLLELAISFAFSGPLLAPCGHEGIGLHLFGPSSCGKTTASRVAGSVCGGGSSGFIKQWRTTDNALESTAAQHNDNLLCLDEIGQASSRVVSETVYMLANGQGKGRANRDGNVKSRHEWRVAFLSTGELTLDDKIAQDGQGRMMAGQAVRVVDIAADGGCGMGVFSLLPPDMTAQDFSRHLVKASQRQYGTALQAFLHYLTAYFSEGIDFVRSCSVAFQDGHCPDKASGQVQRVCGHFGLIAAAGELAIKAGILTWPEGTATKAAAMAFQGWVTRRGGVGDQEIEYALERLKTFFQKYRENRFADLDAESPLRAYNHAGYSWRSSEGRLFLIEISVFREEIVCGAHLPSLTRRFCDLGWFARWPSGKIMSTKHIPGRNTVRGYIFNPAKWENAEVEEAEPSHITQFAHAETTEGEVF